MKIGIVADLHLRGRDLAVKSRVWRHALADMAALGVTHVLDAGDTFDGSGILDRWALPGTLARAYVDPIDETGVEVVVIDGNHTQAGPTQLGALHVLRSHPRIRVVTEPGVVELGGGVQVLCLPWVSRARFLAEHHGYSGSAQDAAFREWCLGALWRLGSLSGGNYRILLGHCEVEGCVAPRYKTILPGSTFSFATADLERIQANLIALGHVHARQGHYVGALTQLNHGESGNPQGWLLVDTDAKTREFRPVDAPKYRTVHADDYDPDAYPAWDHVRVRGAAPPPRLAPNAVWDPVARASETLQREPGIDPRAPAGELLATWWRKLPEADRVGAEAEFARAGQVLADRLTVEDAPSAGALEAVTEVRIAGIGPHADTTVRFPREEWTAVCGRNGSGKTLLLEAAIACWYGRWAHPHRGSLHSTMTEPEARVEVEFVSGGQTYRASRRLRRTAKTTSQECILSRDGSPEAGPKVADFERAVRNLVGPVDQVLGSVFLSQQAEGDLVTADPAARKAFMRGFLGLDRFDALAELAKSAAAEVEVDLASAERQAARLPEVQASVPALEAEQRRAQDAVAAAEAARQRRESDLDDVRQRGEALKTVDQQRQALAEAAAAALRRFEAAREGVRQHEVRAEQLRAFLQREGELQAAVAASQRAREDYEAIQAAARAHDVAKAEKSAARARFEAAELALKRAESEARREVQESERELSRLRSDLARLEQQSAALDRVGCRSSLLACPLIDGAVEARGASESVRSNLAQAEAAASVRRARLESQDFGHAERAALAEARAVLDAAVVPERPDPARLQATSREVEASREAERQLGALVQARGELAHLEADLSNRREAVKREEDDWRAADSSARAARDVSADLTRLRGEYVAASEAAQRSRSALGAAQQELGRAGEALDQARRQVDELAGLLAQVDEKRVRSQRYRLLQRAFGKDGIPQLLIADAVPSIGALLAEVCEQDFEGAFSVRLDTVRESKTGSREVFDVLFRRGDGPEYDARSCSGGEESVVRAALRTALVLYQAARAGTGLRVAWLDEATAGQDAENTEACLRMLDRLRERFPQVILVSHDDALLAGVPNRVMLAGGAVMIEDPVPMIFEETMEVAATW